MNEVTMLREKLGNMDHEMFCGRTAHYSTQYPLVMYIHDYIPDVGHTIPKMLYYNGKRDPYEHVTQFEGR